ncbi:MAG: photosystem reaction center subunit H [Candidatus Aenigmatarchaeota archaeon]|nr:MAG: photosystem reaction center subunit H [Candidatus Aenigmarchaeota archaeon]
MAVNIKSFSEVIGKDVFTLDGKYCGKVKDFKVDLNKFRVTSLVVEVFRGTFLSEILGGEKKGVIVPYSSVESIEDIVLIRNIFKGVSEEKEE